MLRSQPRIHSVKVALLAEREVVEFDPEQWNAEKVINEISDIGFDATLIPPTRSDEITQRIYGMTCSSCTYNIESELGKMPGINSVVVALKTETDNLRPKAEERGFGYIGYICVFFQTLSDERVSCPVLNARVCEEMTRVSCFRPIAVPPMPQTHNCNFIVYAYKERPSSFFLLSTRSVDTLTQ